MMLRNPPKPPLTRSLLDRLVKEWSKGGQTLKYRDPQTGETYSRRRVEQSDKLGGVTYEEQALRNRVREVTNYETKAPVVYDERFGTLLALYTKANKTTKREAIKEGSPFWQALKDLTTRGTGPDTKKAKALVTFGLRRPHWRQAVGKSPEPAPVQLTDFERQHIKATYAPAPAPFATTGREAVLSASTRQRRKKGRRHPKHDR